MEKQGSYRRLVRNLRKAHEAREGRTFRMSKSIVVSEKDWNRIGAELFGSDKLDWRFVCPSCGHVSTGRRFLELDISDPGRVVQECEGRVNPSSRKGCPKYLNSGTKAKRQARLDQIAAYQKEHGCDWCAFGFFCITTVSVRRERRWGESAVFAFDHPDADAKLSAVALPKLAADYVIAPKGQTWAEYKWPDWVPAWVRSHIEAFWAEKWHRSPWEWSTDNQNQGTPPLGARVTMVVSSICNPDGSTCEAGHSREMEGRYVHRWNNIGNLILDDGRVAYV